MASRMSVATSYESLPCYHLLRMAVEDDAGAVVFQPTLVESELLRVLGALQVVDGAKKMPLEEQLGRFVDACGDDRGIDVVACFGKQAAVQVELRQRGWWPTKLEHYLHADAEGVYAIVLPDVRPKVVLFTWLLDSAFTPEHLRERATYALRFVTTLTSTVLCCLTDADWTALELAAAAVSGDRGSSWKKYSVEFSIAEAAVQDEMVSCVVLPTTTRLPEGLALAPSTGPTAMTLRVASETSINTKKSVVGLTPPEAFADWLVKAATTHRLELKVSLPKPCMEAALKAWGAWPEWGLNRVTIASVQEAMRPDVTSNVDWELHDLLERFYHNAKVLCYMVPELRSAAAEERAHAELMADLTSLFNRLDGEVPIPADLSLLPAHVENMINAEGEAMWRSAPRSTGIKSYADATKTPGQCWLAADRFEPFSFPFVGQSPVAMDLIVPRIHTDLEAYNYNWYSALQEFLFEPAVASALIEHALLQADTDANLCCAREALIYEAFVAANDTRNRLHAATALTTTLAKGADADHLRVVQQHVGGGGQMLYLTHRDGCALGQLHLPFQVRILLVTVVDAVLVVVYTDETKTTVRSYTLHGSRSPKKLSAKDFPHAVERCDFNPTQRTLALRHATTNVDLVAFTPTFKKLGRPHRVDLSVLRPLPPFRDVLVFGGDQPGLLCVGADGSAQSYLLQTRQLSKHVPTFVATPATKVVKFKDGAFIVCLVPLDDQSLRVQTTATHNLAPLPETTVALPCLLDWDATLARAYADTIVLLDPTTGAVVELQLTVVSGHLAWQLQCAQQAAPANLSETSLLWAVFHVFEKFPVRAMMDESSSRPALQLRAHASSPARREVFLTTLDAIMTKLASLQKDLTPLSLAKDAIVDATLLVWPTVSLAPWILELVGFVPVPICRAQDNQLVLLRDGVAAAFPDGSEAHTLAPQVGFGAASHVLKAWRGPVVVLTSMGKQSTGKSYFLNHLTGSSFAISGARCTDGVWLTLRQLDQCLVVVLDFEGLGSFERSAQEDTLLSVLNAAVSRLTVFRIEMRFDKDVDGMFAKFQQGVALLKGDERLFCGRLLLNVKDVNPHDQASVVAEFKSKLEAVLSENKANNFVKVMYGGGVNITCCPPLGNQGYYEALEEAACNLHAARAKAYANGADCHDTLSMVLAKISLLDWTNMGDNVQAHKSAQLCEDIRLALRYGCLDDDATLGPDDDAIMTAQRQSMVPDSTLDLPPDEMYDFGLDAADDDTQSTLAAAKTILLRYLQQFLMLVDAPRSLALEARFDAVWNFVVWRREYRVRSWFGSLAASGRDEADLLDVCVRQMKQYLRRCQHTCAKCQLGCFESFLHEANVDHDCGTDHKCAGCCSYCTAGNVPCGAAAGHTGACNCAHANHTCTSRCEMASASNCDGGCHLPIDHDGSHMCNVAEHRCSHPCMSPDCRSLCTQPFAAAHDRHDCGASDCMHDCSIAGCSRPCIVQDHFHAADHTCGADHRCATDCAADGVCEVKVQRTSTTFDGGRSTFEYTQQSMVGMRKKCTALLPVGALDHGGGAHRCDATEHTCAVQCPCCRYYCTKAVGHAGLHATSHGNMTETYFVSDVASVDIAGRAYVAGEDGVAEMCPFFCSKMGRGHVHYVPCDHASADVCTASDGRRHCTTALEPHPTRPMDEVLHATYWKMQGWEDPVASAMDRHAFGLCPYQCAAPSHKEGETSYCTLDAWHAPVVANAPPGHTLVRGHVLPCTHTAHRGNVHHVFVLDSSGSMRGQRWTDVKNAVYEYIAKQRAKKGDTYPDIVSVISFSEGSEIVYEGRPLCKMGRKTCAAIPFRGYGTNYNDGLRAAIEVLSRNDHTTYTPVMLFFTDGRPHHRSNGVDLAQHIATTFGCYEPLSYCVGFGHDDFAFLEELAGTLEGTYHNAVDGVELLATFAKISVAVQAKTGLVSRSAVPQHDG